MDLSTRLFATSAVWLALAASAHAQDSAASPRNSTAPPPASSAGGTSSSSDAAPEQSATSVSEIIVTASKRAETLQSAPIAVQAFSGAQLEKSGTQTITRLVDFIPGASLVQDPGPGLATIQIRGIAAGAVGDATTGYYIDDVPFSIPNLQLVPPSGLFDLERTEVLRGPQGTLYGNGAIGGLIRLVTAAPDTTRFQARAQSEISGTQGGGFNYTDNAVINVPLLSDVAALRVSGGYRHQSGFADSSPSDRPEGSNLNDRDDYNVRAKILFHAGDHLTLTGSIWHIEDSEDYSNTLVSVDPAILPNAHGTSPYQRTIATVYAGVVDWDLGAVGLQSSTSYINHALKFEATIPTQPQNHTAVDSFQSHSFTEEARLTSKPGTAFHWVVGGTYTDARNLAQFDITAPVDLPAPLGTLFLPLVTQEPTPVRTENYAFYGETSYDLMDGKLTPLVGLRYFHDDRRVSGTAILFPTFSPPGIALPGEAQGSFSSVSPRFNLSYKPTSDVTVFGNVAKGFRSGSINTPNQIIFAAQDGVTTSALINPDTVWSYELGTKLRTPDRHLQVEASLYYTDWTGIQLPFNTSSGIVATLNAGSAHIRGVDLSATWRTPLTGLDLNFSGNLNDSHFSRVDAGLAATAPNLKSGSQLPTVPEGNYAIGVNYEHPLTSDVGLNLQATYAFRARQSDAGSGLFSPNLDQLALRAGVEMDHWRIDLFAENALDDRGPLVRTATGVNALYPRRVGLVVNYKY